jgi:hypothetical protein
VFEVRLAQAFQPSRRDALRKSQKPRLHVSRKGGDFRSDRFVEDFHPPSDEC